MASGYSVLSNLKGSQEERNLQFAITVDESIGTVLSVLALGSLRNASESSSSYSSSRKLGRAFNQSKRRRGSSHISVWPCHRQKPRSKVQLLHLSRRHTTDSPAGRCHVLKKCRCTRILVEASSYCVLASTTFLSFFRPKYFGPFSTIIPPSFVPLLPQE